MELERVNTEVGEPDVTEVGLKDAVYEPDTGVVRETVPEKPARGVSVTVEVPD